MHKIIIGILISLISSGLSAQDERLVDVDNILSFYGRDYSAEYTVTIVNPGQAKQVKKSIVFRRDTDDKFVLLQTAPQSEMGKAYLKLGSSIWLFDPSDRRFIVVSANEEIQNSSLKLSDITRSTIANDYNVNSAQIGKLGSFECTILNLYAKNNNVDFPIKKIWVDTNGLVRKIEDYSLSNQLIRVVAIARYTEIEGRFVPSAFVIQEELLGDVINGKFERNQIIISIAKASFQSLSDRIFTQQYLEQISK